MGSFSWQANRPDRAKDILDRAAKFNGKDLGDWVLTPIIKADSDKRFIGSFISAFSPLYTSPGSYS